MGKSRARDRMPYLALKHPLEIRISIPQMHTHGREFAIDRSFDQSNESDYDLIAHCFSFVEQTTTIAIKIVSLYLAIQAIFPIG